ncbi:MAG: type II secretion system protein N [Burkholderiales bacterium]|nr:type II secretion system protein N [Burkholderiales bacterium]MDE2160071.1 type II secretion system protein N [Burkholderiales bacterium]MDE2502631.1 type II secretion system protein N [Burkholderiales bacterium]
MTLWAVAGSLLGGVVALVLFAPANWLASALAGASDGRLLLADARGTVWDGSARLVLTGGPGSRDASTLPGRLDWRLGLDGAALGLRARQACCIDGELHLRLVPGFARLRIELPAPAARRPGAAPPVLGSWPASWLVGLGTPWNTLQPSGAMQLSSPGMALELVAGRWRFSGHAVLELRGIASRVSTLAELGSYRIDLQGDAGATATLALVTLRGALQLAGSGQLLGSGAASTLRFTGQASAAPGSEGALGGLLNIIGQRRGALSVISIG